MDRKNGALTGMWIKICGITRTVDAHAAADAGADAVGLNFYTASKRYICPDEARVIADAVKPNLDVVGVFVNSPVQDVVDIVNRVQLTAVQFHGDESVETIVAVRKACPDIDIVRAYRLREDGVEHIIQEIRDLHRSGAGLAAVLVDAFVTNEYGGTGHMISTDLFREFRKQLSSIHEISGDTGKRLSVAGTHRVILAGGLTPETVASATAATGPWGVDTASGVEISPGKKSSEQIRQFVKAVRTTAPAEPPNRL